MRYSAGTSAGSSAAVAADATTSSGPSSRPMRWPTAFEMGLEGGPTPPPYYEWDPYEHEWVYNQALEDADTKYLASQAAAERGGLCSVMGGRKSSKRKSKKRRSVGRRTLLKRRIGYFLKLFCTKYSNSFVSKIKACLPLNVVRPEAIQSFLTI